MMEVVCPSCDQPFTVQRALEICPNCEARIDLGEPDFGSAHEDQ